MSIVSEIERIKTNISNAYEKANEKGAILPELQNSDNLSSTIDGIEQGIGDISNKLLISTENAILSSSEDGSMNGKTRAFVNRDARIRVDAKVLDGKIFNYMKNGRGEIVSYNFYETFCRSDDCIRAFYSDSEVESESLVFFEGSAYEVIREERTINFFVGCDILSLDNKKSWGLLLSTKRDILDEEMVVGGNASDRPFGELQTQRNARMLYWLRFSNDNNFINHVKVKARAYSIVERDGKEEIVYSRVVTVQL